MSTSILKTHYRRSATVLTSEQIEEIRHLKNKVPAYMIVKEYHINKNRVHDIWNDCERFQQNGNHFLEELKKVQSISSVPPSENNPQEKENNHPISGSLDPFHESIEINAQEKQKKKKKLPKPPLQDQPKSIQSFDLPEISNAGGLYQNSTLDISHDIIALIKKDRTEAEEAIRESEKLLGRRKGS
jgi:hypothetical protein